nr:hypothetical protein GCM10025732_12810 [Glycomyces mayteni]
MRISETVRTRFGRSGVRTALAVLALFSLVTAVLAYLLPQRLAIALTAAVLVAEAGVVVLVALRTYRGVRRAEEARQRPESVQGRSGPFRSVQLTDEQRRILKNWRARLFGGFSATAMRELRPVVTSASASPAYRLAVAEMVMDWYAAKEARSEDRDPLRFDIVITSHFALPGGTTSANAEEIRAYRKAGLTVGLLHHPVYHWDVARPIDQKILDLVDGEQVRLLDAADAAECDLMIVRFPPAVMRLLDDRPGSPRPAPSWSSTRPRTPSTVPRAAPRSRGTCAPSTRTSPNGSATTPGTRSAQWCATRSASTTPTRWSASTSPTRSGTRASTPPNGAAPGSASATAARSASAATPATPA